MTRFLVVADPHYTTKPETNDRKHALSLHKLREAIAKDGDSCDFIVNLGDTTDKAEGFLPQTECFQRFTDVMEKSGLPYYSVIGNHDTATEKHKVVSLCKMPGRYYSVDVGEYLCLFLDASLNDPADPWREGLIDWTKCYIDGEQMEWLRETLERTEKKVLIFCHPCFALKKGWGEDLHLICNRKEAMELFEKSGKVVGVFCGHYHWGDAQTVGGIPYITFAAMCVERDITYGVVTVSGFHIAVEGRGRQQTVIFGK